METPSLNDREIIEGICSPLRRERTIYTIYYTMDWSTYSINYLMKHGATKEEAEEISLNGMVALDRNVRRGDFEGRNESSLKTYYIKIITNMWRNFLRDKKKEIRFEQLAEQEWIDEKNIEDDLISIENKKNFEDLLSKAGNKCEQLLKMKMLGMTDKELAIMMGYCTSDVAKNETSRCRKKLRIFLLKHPVWLNRIK